MADKKSTPTLGTGRRKSAVARIRLFPSGSGKITVNGRSFESYFPTEILRMMVVQPFNVTETKDTFDLEVNVRGGGVAGQAGAVKHGISRALIAVEPTLRPKLKEEGLLTRDSRMKERKKYGQPGARKRFQYSKR